MNEKPRPVLSDTPLIAKRGEGVRFIFKIVNHGKIPQPKMKISFPYTLYTLTPLNPFSS
jgi:hypothetical protein